MSDNLPARLPDGLTNNRQLIRATRAQERTELAIFQHHLNARFHAECEQIDAKALADVARTALDEEMSVLDWGLEQAQGSAVKAELVSRMVAMQSRIDNDRIARRFGG
jgi:hypothetical protein